MRKYTVSTERNIRIRLLARTPECQNIRNQLLTPHTQTDRYSSPK